MQRSSIKCIITEASPISHFSDTMHLRRPNMRPIATIFCTEKQWRNHEHPTKESATASETTNALVLVRSCRLLQTRKVINPFPMNVKIERNQPILYLNSCFNQTFEKHVGHTTERKRAQKCCRVSQFTLRKLNGTLLCFPLSVSK